MVYIKLVCFFFSVQLFFGTTKEKTACDTKISLASVQPNNIIIIFTFFGSPWYASQCVVVPSPVSFGSKRSFLIRIEKLWVVKKNTLATAIGKFKYIKRLQIKNKFNPFFCFWSVNSRYYTNAVPIFIKSDVINKNLSPSLIRMKKKNSIEG